MKLHKNRIVTFLNFHGFYKNEIKKLLVDCKMKLDT